jgi:hypothetical protein
MHQGNSVRHILECKYTRRALFHTVGIIAASCDYDDMIITRISSWPLEQRFLLKQKNCAHIEALTHQLHFPEGPSAYALDHFKVISAHSGLVDHPHRLLICKN